jgi:hypothetical protein
MPRSRVSLKRSLLHAVVVMSVSFPVFAERYALLIGISEYDIRSIRTGVVPLQYADDDAITMKDLLAKQYHVKELVNGAAKREEILKEFARLREVITKDDSFLLFFAGHGVRDPHNNKTYWLTWDTRLDLIEDKGIRLEHLFDFVSELKAKEKIVLLDHCFSGDIAYPSYGGEAAAQGRAGTGQEIGIKRGQFEETEIEAQLAARASGVVYLAAARNEAYESNDLKHGVFTEALRRSMSTRLADNGDGKLSLAELIQFVSTEIPTIAKGISVNQKLVTMRRNVVNEHDWSPVFLLPPPGSEAERIRNASMKVLEKWYEQKWIELQTLVECRDSFESWVAYRHAESDSKEAGKVAAINPRVKRIIDAVLEHVNLAEARAELAKATAENLQATIVLVPR